MVRNSKTFNTLDTLYSYVESNYNSTSEVILKVYIRSEAFPNWTRYTCVHNDKYSNCITLKKTTDSGYSSFLKRYSKSKIIDIQLDEYDLDWEIEDFFLDIDREKISSYQFIKAVFKKILEWIRSFFLSK